ncbi:MAG: hypothetical protein EOP87_00170 [Verrucomicrobiaceae bacterium]|nr:MAG: hypothetical protein EOP87_00170 [Verrucomicrobiaceae bacterium]
MPQTVQASITLQYGTDAQRFTPTGTSAGFAAGVSASGSFNASLTGSASVFSRVLTALNADFDTGSGIGNEGFKFSQFPELEDSAGNPILDVNGLPLDFAKITLLAFRVRAIDPDQPWGGTVDITTSNDVVPGDFSRTGIASECIIQFYESAGWEPGATGEILIEFTPTTAPTPAMVNAMVEMLVIGLPETPAAPAFSAPPTITGTAEETEVLTAVTGTITGTPAPLTGLQWVRCLAGGGSGPTYGTDIPGANAGTYTLAGADVGFSIRVRQTATNSAGSASSYSAATATVIP